MKGIKLKLSLFVLPLCLMFFATKAWAMIDLGGLEKKLNHRVIFSIKLEKAAVLKGAVIGPIAVELRAKNRQTKSSFNDIFRKLNALDEAVRNGANADSLLREIRATLNEQASILDADAEAWESAYNASILTLDEEQFASVMLDVKKYITVKRQVAEDFKLSSENLSHNEIISLAGKNMVKEALGEASKIVVYDSSLDKNDFFNHSILSLLIGNSIHDKDSFFKAMADNELRNRDIHDALRASDIDRLSDKVVAEMKSIEKANPARLSENFEKELGVIVRNELDGYAEERGFADYAEIGKEPQANDETSVIDNRQCAPGYADDIAEFNKCVQIDCEDIANAAFDDDGNCICGNIGDGTELMACEHTIDHDECPECIFACVAVGSPCPLVN